MTTAIEPSQHAGNGERRQLMLATPNTLKDLFERSKEKIGEVATKHLSPERLMRVALVAVSKSELLQKCTASSILQCVMTSSQLGLDCSGVLGSAYMVPFWSSKVGAYEATLIPGYRGLIDLAKRSGDVTDIYAHCVYEGDVFEVDLGTDRRIRHAPGDNYEEDDTKIVGAYMVAVFKDGTRHLEWMPRASLDKVRKSSKSARDGKGPWVDWFSEMCRKTVIRRGSKQLPLTVEMAEALELEDRYHRGEGIPQVIDVGASTEPPKSRTARLTERLSRQTEARVVEESPAGEQATAQDPPQESQPAEAGGNPDPIREAFSGDWEEAGRNLRDALKDKMAIVGRQPQEAVLHSHAKWLGLKDAKEMSVDQRVALYQAIVEGRLSKVDGSVRPAQD